MRKNIDITPAEIKEWLEDTPGTPVQKATVEQSEDDLIGYMELYSVSPSPSLRSEILSKIEELQHKSRVSHSPTFPLLKDNHEFSFWNTATEHIQTPEQFDNVHLHTLLDSEERGLYLVWVKEKVDDEVHQDLIENILLLEGSCTCYITEPAGKTQTVHLNAGDYLSIPIGATHNIMTSSSSPAKGILEWRKIAA